MTQEELYIWIIHLQKRIILQDNPLYKYSILLKLLTCIYHGKSCIENPCEIITYLDNNLPCHPYKDESLKVESDPIVPLNITDCKFYNFRVDIFLGKGANPLSSLYLIQNASFFIREATNYYLDLTNIFGDFPFLFPNRLEIMIYIQKGKNSEYEPYGERTDIGYFIP